MRSNSDSGGPAEAACEPTTAQKHVKTIANISVRDPEEVLARLILHHRAQNTIEI